MKIFYCTDLHGNIDRYQKIIELQYDFDVLLLGADILPKSNRLYITQKYFLNDYLKEFFNQIEKPTIIDFGNDDLNSLYNDFKILINNYDLINYSHKQEVVIEDISFIGLHFVPDYPFGLKDWCRYDKRERIISSRQLSTPIISEGSKFKIIELYDYFDSKLSIHQELTYQLPNPSKEKVIYLLHAPPREIGLDVCSDGTEVGSYAVSNFIQNKRPYFTFHGHIHESPNISNIWYNNIQNTVCVQPGQSYSNNKLTYVSFKIKETDFVLTRYEEEL